MLMGDLIAAIKAALPTTIGDNMAEAAAVTADATADLVSAATNTGGIIITSLSMSVQDATAAAITKMALVVNSVIVAEIITKGDGTFYVPQTSACLCAVKIPAGQAVQYTFDEGGAGTGWIRITWRHA